MFFGAMCTEGILEDKIISASLLIHIHAQITALQFG